MVLTQLQYALVQIQIIFLLIRLVLKLLVSEVEVCYVLYRKWVLRPPEKSDAYIV